MTDKTTLYINDSDVAKKYRNKRDNREMTNAEFLEVLLEEQTVAKDKEQLIESIENLNQNISKQIELLEEELNSNGGDDDD